MCISPVLRSTSKTTTTAVYKSTNTKTTVTMTYACTAGYIQYPTLLCI